MLRRLAVVGEPLRAAGVLSEWRGAPAAPPIELLTASGAPHTLTSLRGKVVLLNFWATWSETCVTELLSLQRARNALAPDLDVLGVNCQGSPARIHAFVAKTGLTFPIVRDTDGAVAKAWGTRVFPSELPGRPRPLREARADRQRQLDESRNTHHNPRVAVGLPLRSSPHNASLTRAVAPFPEIPMKRHSLLRALPAAGLLSTAP